MGGDGSGRGSCSGPPAARVALALNIDPATDEHRRALPTADGRPGPSGAIRFPIRACCPQVALRDGARHVLALGDVVEPVAAWRDHKRARGGGTWDYVFRQLFHADAPDLAAGGFAPPVEVDNVEATCATSTCNLGGDGVVHALYRKTDIVPALLDACFPGGGRPRRSNTLRPRRSSLPLPDARTRQ